MTTALVLSPLCREGRADFAARNVTSRSSLTPTPGRKQPMTEIGFHLPICGSGSPPGPVLGSHLGCDVSIGDSGPMSL